MNKKIYFRLYCFNRNIFLCNFKNRSQIRSFVEQQIFRYVSYMKVILKRRLCIFEIVLIASININQFD